MSFVASTIRIWSAQTASVVRHRLAGKSPGRSRDRRALAEGGPRSRPVSSLIDTECLGGLEAEDQDARPVVSFLSRWQAPQDWRCQSKDQEQLSNDFAVIEARDSCLAVETGFQLYDLVEHIFHSYLFQH